MYILKRHKLELKHLGASVTEYYFTSQLENLGSLGLFPNE